MRVSALLSVYAQARLRWVFIGVHLGDRWLVGVWGLSVHMRATTPSIQSVESKPYHSSVKLYDF
jgi:hypothetical protein